VGTNPTFDGQSRRVEAYVLGAPGDYDLYGHWVDLDFVERIRSMEKFDSVDALIAQMDQDVARTREVLRS
jgi:riboflavin kinase/FMN adenylyltransferase